MSIKIHIPSPERVGKSIIDDSINSLLSTKDNSTLSKITEKVLSYQMNNKFIVTVTPPMILPVDSVSDTETLSFNCHKAKIPGVSYGTFDYRLAEDVLSKRPNDKIYTELTLSFYNILTSKTKTLAWDFWNKWMNIINNKGKYEYYEYYIGVIHVTQLGNDGTPVKSIRFNEAYPTSISDIELDFSSTDTIQSFDITIMYKTWEQEESPIMRGIV